MVLVVCHQLPKPLDWWTTGEVRQPLGGWDGLEGAPFFKSTCVLFWKAVCKCKLQGVWTYWVLLQHARKWCVPQRLKIIFQEMWESTMIWGSLLTEHFGLKEGLPKRLLCNFCSHGASSVSTALSKSNHGGHGCQHKKYDHQNRLNAFWAVAIISICQEIQANIDIKPCMISLTVHVYVHIPCTLQDILNDYVLTRLEAFRRQPPPKALFEKPEAGPSSVEMESWHKWCQLMRGCAFGIMK